MGYLIRFEGAGEPAVFSLGSATALGDMQEWVKRFPATKLPRLHEFVDTLTTTNTMELGAELEAALDASPPPESLRPIAEHLMKTIGVGDEEETITAGQDFDDTEADRKAVENSLRPIGDEDQPRDF